MEVIIQHIGCHLVVLLLTLISYLSVKKMLKGTAADALRPYTPKAMKKSVLEKLSFWEKLPFGTKINLSESSENAEIKELAEDVEGDWQASSGISYEGETISLEIYQADNQLIRFVNEEDELVQLDDDGYLR